ncbi:hypothetical protein HZS55_08790 [Halosimplex rubrum]|uniref:Uncharacterized protein n=1 Tax=Halosimplex rubrum TaxID=869889 RepID=A0A7D5NZJ8_9EURY|nr:hypothetical protein [Halosimplex rubrum]QLH77383.1 hypothetical protein HZS55_08790 [Halosimplex rubrum]
MGPSLAHADIDSFVQGLEPESFDPSSPPENELWVNENARQFIYEVREYRNRYVHADFEWLSDQLGVPPSEIQENPETITEHLTEKYFDVHFSFDRDETEPSEEQIENWGYVQCVAFSLNTAFYLVDSYLERNRLETTVGEIKQRYWVLVLAMTILEITKTV